MWETLFTKLKKIYIFSTNCKHPWMTSNLHSPSAIPQQCSFHPKTIPMLFSSECSLVTFCIFLSFFSFFLLGFLGLLKFAFRFSARYPFTGRNNRNSSVWPVCGRYGRYFFRYETGVYLYRCTSRYGIYQLVQ